MMPASGDQEDGVAKLPGGGELAYQIRGRTHGGTPALLLRPLGGSMALWGSFRSLLAERLHVVAFDHRGAGHSSAAPGCVTTQGLAADALHLLDHLGISRADVFGISLGGMAATWLGILAPHRVARLCLASTPSRGIELSRAGVHRELALASCFLRPRDRVEAALVDRILSRRFRDAEPEAVRRIEALVRVEPTSRTALLEHALAGLRHDVRREVHRIKAPTLILAGEDDHLLGLTAPRELASRIPGAIFEVIPACGHDLTLEQPVVTATRVAEFFGERECAPAA
jgi:3-oxoadipate enol-lactonase